MDPGDIVRDKRGVLWAVIEETHGPRGTAWRLGRIADGRSTARVVYGPLEVIASPEFEPGQRIKIGNHVGEVIQDNGGATILCRYSVDDRHGGVYGPTTYLPPRPRGLLVQDNLRLFT
jgi:hypothetical protein